MGDVKSLKEITLNITEEEYRQLPQLSYSAIARYEKGGFSVIPHLYDKIEGESLTFGSMVDTLITEGAEKFREKFAVADFEVPTDSIKDIIDLLVSFSNEDDLQDVSDESILSICDSANYQPRWGSQIRINKIREKGRDYYNRMKSIGDRTLVPNEMYQKALATVAALKNSPQTAKYFEQSSDTLEFLYQQKFVEKLDGVEFKCMVDLLIVDHTNKTITPVDLKTTSAPEYEFPKKYIEFRYDIQSRLYWRILKKVLSNSIFFSYALLDFTFIVVNKDNLTPMIFRDRICKVVGDYDIEFKTNSKKVLRDPVVIGKELQYYLDTNARVPYKLDISKPIDIHNLMKLMF